MEKILHIGYLHGGKDNRILLKECSTLSQSNFDVTYITSSNSINNEFLYDNVKVYEIKKHGLNKILKLYNYLKFIKKYIKINNVDILHIHEPLLLLIVYLINYKNKNFKIIFDSHENYHGYLYGITKKSNILKIIKYHIISFLTWTLIKKTMSKIDLVITAGRSISDSLLKYNKNIYEIFNYPILEDNQKIDFRNKKVNKFVYVGGVNNQRMIPELVEIFDNIDNSHFSFAGPIYTEVANSSLEENNKSKYLGILNRKEIDSLYKEATIGLIILSPEKNHYDIQSNKLFEYMQYGLCVIVSNFPKWVDFIDTYKCGIYVDPNNLEEIKEKIIFLSKNPNLVEEYGMNGINSVKNNFSWNIEKIKLIKLYKEVLSK